MNDSNATPRREQCPAVDSNGQRCMLLEHELERDHFHPTPPRSALLGPPTPAEQQRELAATMQTFAQLAVLLRITPGLTVLPVDALRAATLRIAELEESSNQLALMLATLEREELEVHRDTATDPLRRWYVGSRDASARGYGPSLVLAFDSYVRAKLGVHALLQPPGDA